MSDPKQPEVTSAQNNGEETLPPEPEQAGERAEKPELGGLEIEGEIPSGQPEQCGYGITAYGSGPYDSTETD